MSHVLVSNGIPGVASVRIGNKTHELAFTDHVTLFRELLGLSDACVLAAPYLYEDFTGLFEGLPLDGVQVELISSFAVRGQDQLTKPFSLRSVGQVIEKATGRWPLIGLNACLHSKIYVFSRDAKPFAGLVTSANLTDAGLRRNHETGALLGDPAKLHELMHMARRGLHYVNLAPHQIEQLCKAVDAYRARNAVEEEDVNVGLANILNTYATPSAGNRSTRLVNDARFYVKVSGVRDRPILPEQRRPFNVPHCQLDFARSPDKVRIGDCLLEVAVGGQCFLSYYACASAPYERTAAEKDSDEDYVRWPFYVWANNQSLHYGEKWFEAPLTVKVVEEQFHREYPGAAVTEAGGDNILGPIQRGNSYFEVTREFGLFMRQKIDEFVAP